MKKDDKKEIVLAQQPNDEYREICNEDTFRAAFRRAQKDFSPPGRGEKGQHKNHTYASADDWLAAARKALHKNGCILLLYMGDTFETALPHDVSGGGKTTMAWFHADAVDLSEGGGRIGVKVAVDLFGSASIFMKDGEKKFSMSPIQENGSAITYGIRYAIPLLMGQAAVAEDPDKQPNHGGAARSNPVSSSSGSSADDSAFYATAKAAQKAARAQLNIDTVDKDAFTKWQKEAFEISKNPPYNISAKADFYRLEEKQLRDIYIAAANKLGIGEDVPF